MENTEAWKAAENAIAVPQKYGFTYEYTYDKSSDSSCVYVHRFKKGKDKFELRVLSGAETVSAVAYVGGEYRFPNVKKQYKNLWRARAHAKGIFRLFRKPSEKDGWDFYAAVMEEEAKHGAIFGIPVTPPAENAKR